MHVTYIPVAEKASDPLILRGGKRKFKCFDKNTTFLGALKLTTFMTLLQSLHEEQ